MISLLFIIVNIILTGIEISLWRKHKDINFFFISLIGVISVPINILSLFGEVSLSYSIPLLFVFSGTVNWYDWKKFRIRKSFWYFILSILGLFIALFGFYVNKIDFFLPIGEWPALHIIYMLIIIIVFVAFLIV